MSVVHVPDSAWAKEATKWEAENSLMGPGLRRYVKRDYPMMLHKAILLSTGGIDIVENQVVDDAEARARWERLGFRATPLEAIDALKAEQAEYATLAAEREYEKRRKLSPRAAAEVTAAEEDAGAQHLPTIPETPIKRRGRPKKPTVVES